MNEILAFLIKSEVVTIGRRGEMMEESTQADPAKISGDKIELVGISFRGRSVL